MINKLPDISKIRTDIDRQGFSICENCIDIQIILDLKNYWVKKFENIKVDKKHVGGNFYLGEKNFSSFSNTKSLCLNRHFDFLWNNEENIISRSLNIEMHKFRNKIQNYNENLGIEYSKDCYGFYISTSFYRSNKGRMREHIDIHQNKPILQYMIPITFKGSDYDEGGLFIMNKKNEWIDVDKISKIGSVIFFDGRQKHKVEKIISTDSKKKIGRIAVFAIPTFFKKDARLGSLLRDLKIFSREIVDYPIEILKFMYKKIK